MIDISKIYKTNCSGDLKIIKYRSSKDIDVEFISTGYITTAEAAAIRKGEVKDRLHPKICGVGFIGVGDHKSRVRWRYTKKYDAWKSMIYR